MQCQRCLTRDGLDQHHMPPRRAVTIWNSPARQLDPAERSAADPQGRNDHPVDAGLPMEVTNRIRQAWIAALVGDRAGPARLVCHEMTAEALVREWQPLPTTRVPLVKAIDDVRHPHVAALLIVVEQPDRAHTAAGQ